MNSNLSTAIEWSAKILSVLVIPTLFWINSLEIERALLSQTIVEIQEKVSKNTEDLSKIQQMVNTNALTLTRIEVTLGSLDRTLQEVKQALRQHEHLHTNAPRRPAR